MTLATLALLPSGAIAAFSETTLFGFNTTDGDQPGGQLIQASDGNFYGTTCEGGASAGSNSGVIWKLALDGTQTVVHSFAAVVDDGQGDLTNGDGDCPHGVVQGADGLLYGVTELGGANGGGVIFRLALDGSVFQTLHSFGNLHSVDQAILHDGVYPLSTLTPGTDGNFYGTTEDGGAFDSHGGTIFRISPAGNYEVLHSFAASFNNAGSSIDGSGPIGTLLQGDDGDFYGVTYAGGDRSFSDGEGGVTDNGSGGGTAYRFDAVSGQLFTLHAFKLFDTSFGDGYEPRTNLAEAADHTFYGATAYGSGSGGDSDYGTLFSIDRGGDFILLHNFTDPNSDGTPPTPYGIVLGSDGNVYGTTKFSADGNAGSVFQFTPMPARSFDTLYEFGQLGSLDDGIYPGGPMVQGSDGSFFGTLLGEGPNANSDGGGAVFRLAGNPALPPPVQLSLTPASIALGASSTLAWTVLNATSDTYSYCFASDAWSGLKDASGSTTLTPAAAGRYRYALTCGGVETGFASLTVLGASPPPTVTIALDPSSINLGAVSRLSWSSTGASACAASGAWSGSKPTAGSLEVEGSALGGYAYTLSCSGDGGTASSSATLTVSAQSGTTTGGTTGQSTGGTTGGTTGETTGGTTGGTTTGGATGGSAGGTSGGSTTGGTSGGTTTGGSTTGSSTSGGTTGGTGGDLNLPVKAGGAFGLPALLSLLGLAGLRRRRWLRALLPGLLSAVAAGAQADSTAPAPLMEQLYGGVRIGAMDLLLDRREFDRQLAAAGYQVAVREKSDAAAGTVYLGYSIHPLVGVELGYSHRDDTVLTISGISPPNLQSLLDTAVKDLHGYGDIYSASLRLHGHVLPRLSLTPRVGVIYWDDKTTARANGLHASASHSGGGVTLGGGASYRLWRGLAIGAGVDYFGGNPDNDAVLYAGTVEWSFGH